MTASTWGFPFLISTAFKMAKITYFGLLIRPTASGWLIMLPWYHLSLGCPQCVQFEQVI